MSALTTRTEDDRGNASRRKQGRVHPAQATNELRLTAQVPSCLMIDRFDDWRIFGNLEGVVYHAGSQGCLESRISSRNLVEDALYLRLSYLLGFPWNGAPFYS